MLDIQVDGIWCPKCKTLHPTLYWHDKYDDWLKNKKERHPSICEKFGINIDYLHGLSIVECETSNCIVCGAKTNYADEETGNPVCSDECKYNSKNI